MKLIVALLAVTLLGCGSQPATHVGSKPKPSFRYDGVHLIWNPHLYPKVLVNFDVYYDSGHEPFYSTIYLNHRPEFHSDQSDAVGCNWQHWQVYKIDTSVPTSSPNYMAPTRHPAPSRMIASGKIFICRGAT